MVCVDREHPPPLAAGHDLGHANRGPRKPRNRAFVGRPASSRSPCVAWPQAAPRLPFSAAGTRLAADTVAAVRLSDRGHDVFEIRLEIGWQSSGSDRLVHLQPQGLYAFIRGDVVGQADHLIERHV